ncbi:MAG: hypothetical protein COA42_18995, partial [Alteromonadaceae bacterium]
TDANSGNDAGSSAFSAIAGGVGMTLNFDTDCWGSESTWVIQDGGGTVVSGGPYSNVSGGESLVET